MINDKIEFDKLFAKRNVQVLLFNLKQVINIPSCSTVNMLWCRDHFSNITFISSKHFNIVLGWNNVVYVSVGIYNVEQRRINVVYFNVDLNVRQLWSVFLTNELRVTSYELRVTTYCTSYELLFICKLRVTIYGTSYELLFTYELRVITYCTSYELIFSYELRVTIYCTSYELNF